MVVNGLSVSFAIFSLDHGKTHYRPTHVMDLPTTEKTWCIGEWIKVEMHTHPIIAIGGEGKVPDRVGKGIRCIEIAQIISSPIINGVRSLLGFSVWHEFLLFTVRIVIVVQILVILDPTLKLIHHALCEQLIHLIANAIQITHCSPHHPYSQISGDTISYTEWLKNEVTNRHCLDSSAGMRYTPMSQLTYS